MGRSFYEEWGEENDVVYNILELPLEEDKIDSLS